MNDQKLTFQIIDQIYQESRRDDLTFSERAAIYSLLRNVAADIDRHIEDHLDGHGYAHEKVGQMVWHIGAVLGFDITNGHDRTMHLSWALGAIGTLQDVLSKEG